MESGGGGGPGARGEGEERGWEGGEAASRPGEWGGPSAPRPAPARARPRARVQEARERSRSKRERREQAAPFIGLCLPGYCQVTVGRSMRGCCLELWGWSPDRILTLTPS